MEQVYNPFLPLNEYIPDGEPHVFGDRVYLYGSHDKEGGTAFCMLDYTVYSASVFDLKEWRCEGTIYRSEQDPHVTSKRKYMYAPDVVKGNDGRYYLYYALEGFSGPISVAVCDTPAGRYAYYGDVKNPDGSPFTRMIPFDPGVINDDGVIRLYYGWALPMNRAKSRLGRRAVVKLMQILFSKTKAEIVAEPDNGMGANTVVLADDMLTVLSEPARIAPSQEMAAGTAFDGHAFLEASSVRKIDGTYYFIYSSKLNHELCYATSRFPDRGFAYRGTIISNGDVGYHGRRERDRLNCTGNNHGSIEQIDGKWYVFYHRHTHKSTFGRQACAERIAFLEDGSIPQVEMTSCGLNGGPLRAKGEYPAVIACNLTNGRMPHLQNGCFRFPCPHITHRDGERLICGISPGVRIGYKYFEFQGKTEIAIRTRGSGRGRLLVFTDEGDVPAGEIRIEPSAAWRVGGTQIETEGTKPLYFKFRGRGRTELLSFSLDG